MRWILLGGLGVLVAISATAQPPQGRGRGGAALDRGDQRPSRQHLRPDAAEDGQRQRGHRPPPPSPLLMVLDQDRDGQLSAAEIEAAAAALRTLDRNQDGVVDRRELRPPRDGRGDRFDGDRSRRSDKAGRGNRGRRGPVTPVEPATESGEEDSD